jgi:hypothetical protein
MIGEGACFSCPKAVDAVYDTCAQTVLIAPYRQTSTLKLLQALDLRKVVIAEDDAHLRDLATFHGESVEAGQRPGPLPSGLGNEARHSPLPDGTPGSGVDFAGNVVEVVLSYARLSDPAIIIIIIIESRKTRRAAQRICLKSIAAAAQARLASGQPGGSGWPRTNRRRLPW